MKTSKKMLSLLLIAAMLVSVLCVGVSATEDYDPVSTAKANPLPSAGTARPVPS